MLMILRDVGNSNGWTHVRKMAAVRLFFAGNFESLLGSGRMNSPHLHGLLILSRLGICTR